MKITQIGRTLKDFKGHLGRKGKQGGSLPRNYTGEADGIALRRVVKVLEKDFGGDHKNPVSLVQLDDDSRAILKRLDDENEVKNELDAKRLGYFLGAPVPDVALYPLQSAKFGILMEFKDGYTPMSLVVRGKKEKGQYSDYVSKSRDTLSQSPQQAAAAAALDFITGQQDRHWANWLIDDKNQTFWLIDNGCSSHPERTRQINMGFIFPGRTGPEWADYHSFEQAVFSSIKPSDEGDILEHTSAIVHQASQALLTQDTDPGIPLAQELQNPDFLNKLSQISNDESLPKTYRLRAFVLLEHLSSEHWLFDSTLKPWNVFPAGDPQVYSPEFRKKIMARAAQLFPDDKKKFEQ